MPAMNERFASERGAALIIALMVMMLFTALGLSLVMTTTTETTIAGNYRNGQEALYAADAVLERALDDLLTVPDWNTMLSGATQSGFIDPNADGSPVHTLPDGSQINMNEVINVANCGHTAVCSATELNAVTADRPWGANNPRWQVYAYGPANNMLPTATINSQFYVVLLVADDPSENDNDPTKDGISTTNPGTGVLALRAEAFGPSNTHKVVMVTVAKTDTTEIERGYTGQRGQDEQNRRARKAAVQTPGKSLKKQELNTLTGAVQ